MLLDNFEGDLSMRLTAAMVTPCKSYVHNIVTSALCYHIVTRKLCLAFYRRTLESKLHHNPIKERIEFSNRYLLCIDEDRRF